MTSKSETTPLVGSTGENPSYYFLQRTESMMKSTDNMEAEGEVVEMQPNGATGGEFDSRPVKTGGRARTPKKKATFWGATLKPPSGRIGQSGGAARGGSPSKRISGAILRQRQGAIKVEPKVFFANERTFLAWLHCSVLLAGASIAVMAFAEADVLSQLYGVILLPVAIAFLAYSMLQCECAATASFPSLDANISNRSSGT